MSDLMSQASGSICNSFRSSANAMDEEYINQVWEMLKKGLQEIQRKNNSGLSFTELYSNAFTMVLLNYGEKLYKGLKQVVEDHLRNNVRMKIVESLDSGNFLETINEAWNDHTTTLVMIGDVLMYMDRVYVEQNKIEHVFQLGLVIFREQVLYQDSIYLHLRTTLLSLIHQERRGIAVNWTGIKTACQMLVSLGIHSAEVYVEEFETPFLLSTAEYYRCLSMSFLASNSAILYVRKVEQWITDESERAKRYLDPQTEGKVLDVLANVLIKEHVDTIVNAEHSGVHVMLGNDKYDNLATLYGLLERVEDGLVVLADAMSRYLRQTIAATVKEDCEKSPVAFVEDLLELKERFDEFLRMSFQHDKMFKSKIETEFETLINRNKNSPEYLSLYMDEKLRKGLNTENDENAERLLDKAMVLFRFLQEKDVFEKYYEQHMAKRLLLDKSISDDMEKMMISKLKTECGCHFTLKLENMFRDNELCVTHANAFKEYCESASRNVREPAEVGGHIRDTGTIDISVRVLTAAMWPTQSIPVCILPTECERAFNMFNNFYISKHNGRKLTLNTMLGTAEVKAVFYGPPSMRKGDSSEENETRKEENKILVVNTHQMLILLCFNNQPRITFQALMNQTNIPGRELKLNLKFLTMGKPTQRVLSRKGKGKDIDDLDEFFVNDNFQSKLTRIKIPLTAFKGESEPEKETRAKVEDERKYEVAVAIVRVMKSRKVLDHNNLVTEVTQQLKHRFLPNPILIEKRIESLIERGYLARHTNDFKLYNYVA